MNDDKYTIESGFLPVGNGHKIYYQRWGNPDAAPTFNLHGGPGSGSKDRYRLNFDPVRHQVIFHDQRGSGKSTPFAGLKHNTTQDLIADIETLRKKFGFSKIQITGGSWGSCLALAYAIDYPQNVSKLLLTGIFTGRKSELDYIQQGGLRTHFPDAWAQYIELVPEKARKDTSKYYLEKMLNSSDEDRMEHVKRWCLLENSAMSIDSDYDKSKLETQDYDDTSRALAILEAHYFVNNCFLSDDHILNNAQKLAHIPTVLVHGRFDHVCPPETAYALAEAMGDNCHLQFVPASHGREGAAREAMRAYTWSFLG